jgi:peroxiredoxin
VDHARAFDAAGFAIVAVSPDPAWMCAQLRRDLSAPFQILSDASASVISACGLSHHEAGVPHMISRPAIYVVDAFGIVQYRYVGRAANDRPTTALLLLAAENVAESGRESS